jgi:flavin-dependent dehydrogenase
VNQTSRPENSDVTIVGGGLAGLITAILLVRDGIPAKVIEKKRYPFHRVCGEYISNETVPFLESQGLFPSELQPSSVTEFQLTSVNGSEARLHLDLGGFGISRYAFDDFLYKVALKEGVEFALETEVEDISFKEDVFELKTTHDVLHSRIVIGSYGKRSRIDHQLNRPFIHRRSPWVGVKYHARTKQPPFVISLHNFPKGYCGISNVEDGKTNVCYLTHRDNIRQYGTIAGMEENILFRNPWLKKMFLESEFLFEKPEVINEISFETKQPVDNHLLMTGDAAGMIAPLCGNGMAMAIRSALIASRWVSSFAHGRITRDEMEFRYAAEWKSIFATRLWAGRQVQRLFGGESASNGAVWVLANMRLVGNVLVRSTHGRPFR